MRMTDPNVSSIASRIAKNMQTIGFLSSHKPVSIAASIVYVVAEKTTGRKIQRKLVSAKLDVSEATLEKLYKVINKKYEKLIDDNFIKEHKKKLDETRASLTTPDRLTKIYNNYRMSNPLLFDNVGI
jgi:transcription initiation factor TFIIIB Brf1 subunit/transcription initiation factor TFIIB